MEGKGGKERERKRRNEGRKERKTHRTTTQSEGVGGGDLGVDLVGSRIPIMEDTLRGQCEDS